MMDRRISSGRARVILDTVLRAGRVSVDELTHATGASPATVRRDLAALESRGLLQRSHGQAHSPSSFQDESMRQADEKRRIGLVAASLVQPGQVIAISAGTTSAQVARALPPHRQLTVVTNTLNVALELSRRPDLKVFVPGGFVSPGWFSLNGPNTIETLRSFLFDWVFLSAGGVDPRRGVTDPHGEEAALNRMLVRQARQVVIVADHTKLLATAPHVICSVEETQLIVTDAGAKPSSLRALRKLTRVRTA
jgi:DeoR family transcriptional regulator of aga operon